MAGSADWPINHVVGDPAGIYFGTNSGSVFASIDQGDNWQEIARRLPTVLSVEVMETR